MTLSKIMKHNCILSSTTHQASEERGVIGSFIFMLHIVITGMGYFNWWMFLGWLLILGLNFFWSVFGALVVPRIEKRLWDCVFIISFGLLGCSLMLECLRLNLRMFIPYAPYEIDWDGNGSGIGWRTPLHTDTQI